MASIWSSEKNLSILRQVKAKTLTAEEAADKIGCSLKAVKRKLPRLTDDPVQEDGRNWKPWSVPDMMGLYAMHGEEKTWIEIGQSLNRTPISCERKWQDTNWTVYLTTHAAGEHQGAAPLVEKRLATHVLGLDERVAQKRVRCVNRNRRIKPSG